MATQTTLPSYDAAASRAARLALLSRRRNQNLPGYVRRRLDDSAADLTPGDSRRPCR